MPKHFTDISAPFSFDTQPVCKDSPQRLIDPPKIHHRMLSYPENLLQINRIYPALSGAESDRHKFYLTSFFHKNHRYQHVGQIKIFGDTFQIPLQSFRPHQTKGRIRVCHRNPKTDTDHPFQRFRHNYPGKSILPLIPVSDHHIILIFFLPERFKLFR